MVKLAVSLCALLLAPVALAAEPAGPAGEAGGAVEWRQWAPGNDITNIASLQRGARNFMGYCIGCHSLRFVHYTRLGEDLQIPEEELQKAIVQPGDKKNDYIITSLAPSDGEVWFGKAPPDLSLMSRARGPNYIYQYLKGFYSDPKAPTGVNNLVLPGTAMPHVLSELQGVNEAVFREVEVRGEGGQMIKEKQLVALKPIVAGRLSAADYDAFVRDTVNFLEYVGEPTAAKRQSLGVWVLLFLLVFTGIAYMLYKEYWKDVK
jgi:ubiquinol-cytochrome c reductase cytochrome c1 subunit